MNDQDVIRVAYADDHVATRESVTMFISQYQTINVEIQADNGQQLIEMLEQSAMLPDVILLDINMYPKNGYETQIELTKRWPQIKSLVFNSPCIRVFDH
jgi:DNA-binding NarL/FixJ family response regulator